MARRRRFDSSQTSERTLLSSGVRRRVLPPGAPQAFFIPGAFLAAGFQNDAFLVEREGITSDGTGKARYWLPNSVSAGVRIVSDEPVQQTRSRRL